MAVGPAEGIARVNDTRTHVLKREPELLMVMAALVLVAFYYMVRADTIGSLSAGRGWYSVTGEPLSPALHFIGAAVLLGALPVLTARWLLGFRLSQLGLGIGQWRMGCVWLAIGIPLALLAGKIGSLAPEMRAVYPLDPTVSAAAASFVPHALREFLYYGAWEVLFRGVLLFGLKDRLGAGPANALQMAISVTAHFGRPLTESFAAVPAGLVFGWIGLRVGSIWYVALIHWMVGVSLDWFILTS